MILDDNDDKVGYGNIAFTESEDVNLLSSPQNMKCVESDKEVLWKRPESPKSSGKTYVNDGRVQELHHYESPVKFRPKAENAKSTSERPMSYLDMRGSGEPENQALLENNVEVSKITSL